MTTTSADPEDLDGADRDLDVAVMNGHERPARPTDGSMEIVRGDLVDRMEF